MFQIKKLATLAVFLVAYLLFCSTSFASANSVGANNEASRGTYKGKVQCRWFSKKFDNGATGYYWRCNGMGRMKTKSKNKNNNNNIVDENDAESEKAANEAFAEVGAPGKFIMIIIVFS